MTLACSFCGKSEPTINLVMARNDAQICADCIAGAHQVLDGHCLAPPFYSVHERIRPRRAAPQPYDGTFGGMLDAAAIAEWPFDPFAQARRPHDPRREA